MSEEKRDKTLVDVCVENEVLRQQVKAQHMWLSQHEQRIAKLEARDNEARGQQSVDDEFDAALKERVAAEYLKERPLTQREARLVEAGGA